MKPFTPPFGQNQPIPLPEASAETAWLTYQALVQAALANPQLKQDPMMEHFLRVSYNRFESAMRGAA